MNLRPLFLLLLTFTSALIVNAETKAPNIILIFVDDLGFGDVSSYGSKSAFTPAIDALAEGGFRSTDCLVGASVCGPSRAALMTGRYPMRNGHPISRHNTIKYANYGLAGDEVTIPEQLKKAGYYTKIIGKWHLGFHVDGSHPLEAGFDDYFGLHGNYVKNFNDQDTLYHNHEVVAKNVKFTEVTPLYTQNAVNFIEQEHEEPFFLYFAHHIPHTPISPNDAFKGKGGMKGKKGRYADYVYELDDSVKQVTAAVEKAGLAENTLIVFLSDNGSAPHHGSAIPLAGSKYITLEGGLRVPCIFSWPGKIPAGQVSDTMISSMDLLPLFSALAGVDLPAGVTLDGKNIWNILTGETTQSPHKHYYYYNGVNLQAVRNADWKLHLPRTLNDQPYWAKKDRPFTTLDKPVLFDLKNDIGETTDVYDANPEVVKELQAAAERIRAEIGDLETKGTDQRPHGLPDPQSKI
ncbi:MAG: sulfatase-like hydrolase/transferase [Akkermansiaceae bacterium]